MGIPSKHICMHTSNFVPTKLEEYLERSGVICMHTSNFVPTKLERGQVFLLHVLPACVTL